MIRMSLFDTLKSKGKEMLTDEKTKNYATKAINELSDQIDKKSGITDDDSDDAKDIKGALKDLGSAAKRYADNKKK